MGYKMREENESGVYEAKRGYYKGHETVFTHRDPKTGKVFGEDPEVCDWVDQDSVKFRR